MNKARFRFLLFFDRIGQWAVDKASELLRTLYLLSELSSWALFLPFGRHKAVRPGAFTRNLLDVGLSALPILFFIMFLVGFVSALQAAAQLRMVGGNIFVADLLAVGMTAEMAPLMTAVIVAGRSGSAMASEIATMKYTEELDALSVMGLHPIRFVMVPKLWAMLCAMPILTLFANAVGMLGGTLIAIFYLDLSLSAFWRELTHALFIRNIVSGLVKSAVFGMLITVTACHKGLEFKGGAEGVGKATTASVVASLFYIIAADSVIGLLFYF